MSDLCHICGPVKHEAPTVICAPCALTLSGREAQERMVIEARCDQQAKAMFQESA